MERDFIFLRKVVLVELWFSSVAILVCGIVYGLLKDRWLDATECIAILLVSNCICAFLIYLRAKQRMRNFAAFSHSAGEESIPEKNSTTRHGADSVHVLSTYPYSC